MNARKPQISTLFAVTILALFSFMLMKAVTETHARAEYAYYAFGEPTELESIADGIFYRVEEKMPHSAIESTTERSADLFNRSLAAIETYTRDMTIELFGLTEFAPVEEISEPEDEWEYLGEFKLTFYCPGKCCNANWVGKTASGAEMKVGTTIGANTNIFPFGTVVMIDGYGEFVVEDSGGAMRRNKYLLDILVETHEETIVLGVRKAEVWVRK